MTVQDVERFLPLSSGDLQLLLVLMDGDRHAYGIALAVAEKGAGAVRLGVGSLYRMLARLQEVGLIAEDPIAQPSPVGPSRKVYAVTDLGKAVVEGEVRRLRAVISDAETVLGVAGAK